METNRNTYKPETVSHPGTTLSEKLKELGLGSKEFAVRTGKPEKTISHILNEESSITADMAVLFEGVLKIPANFWMKRQAAYDEAVARLKRQEAIESAKSWVANFPYANMAKLGWVASTRKLEEKVENLFNFFAVGSAAAFTNYYFEKKVPVSFRVSLAHTKKPYAFAAWLRKGELQASQLPNKNYDKQLLQSLLPELKRIMAEQSADFFTQLQSTCLKAGVRVVYTPCLEGASVHGSTRWVGDIPLIQLSARYRQNDIFWFTFFHELAHILKHGKKYVALENVDYDDEEQAKEQEADDFAIEWTFSKAQEKEVLANTPLKVDDIIKYANAFGTHPALIIGRFHHKKLLHYSKGREFIKAIDLSGTTNEQL
jgi:addiction module HigA family antidote